MSELPTVERNRIDSSLGARWRHRTLIAFIVCRLLIVLAAGLVFGGAALYFANFNFAGGGDFRGMWILFAGVIVGAIAIIGDLYGIYAAWRTRIYTGSTSWLIMTILIPAVEITIWAMLRKRL